MRLGFLATVMAVLLAAGAPGEAADANKKPADIVKWKPIERPAYDEAVADVEAGRFFSLMVLSSRAAAVVGPFIWALAVDGLTSSMGVGFAYRSGVATVALGMVLASTMPSCAVEFWNGSASTRATRPDHSWRQR